MEFSGIAFLVITYFQRNIIRDLEFLVITFLSMALIVMAFLGIAFWVFFLIFFSVIQLVLHFDYGIFNDGF